MKWILKWVYLLLVSTFCMSVSSAFAAEKNKTLAQCDATRSAIETAAGKIEGNKEAAADLERARNALKNAEECYKAGTPMFFGDISPETEKEIKISVDMADLATATALSRVEFVRATAELEAIEKQFTAVKSKLKLFEDRKAELEKLRLDVAACRKTSNELETIKVEKAALTLQVDQLSAERSRADKLKIEQLELIRKMDEMKVENALLSGLLVKQQAETKAPPAPAVIDPKKKATKKP
jgi:DNA repair exonuclease SbcCD ATPase subunit